MPIGICNEEKPLLNTGVHQNHLLNRFLSPLDRLLLDRLGRIAEGALLFAGRGGDPASEADPLEPSDSSVDSETSLAAGEGGGDDARMGGVLERMRPKWPEPKLGLEVLFARECGEGLRRGPNRRAHMPAGATTLGLWVPLGRLLVPKGGTARGPGGVEGVPMVRTL